MALAMGIAVSTPSVSRAQGRASRSLRALRIDSTSTGWDLELRFDFSVRYLRHSPNGKGRLLRILVDPIDLGRLDRGVGPLREILPLPNLRNAPIVEIAYDPGLNDEPFVEIQFARVMQFDVEQGGDLERVNITIRDVPHRAASSEELQDDGSKAFQMLTRAKRAIRDRDLDVAISILTKILETEDSATSSSTRREAQELLGLAHERGGQEAHARAEYEQYLRDYPDSPGAERVQQRLEALVTAASAPRAALKAQQKSSRRAKEDSLDYDVFGSFALTYFRSESMFAEEGADFLATNVLADADLAGRVTDDDWEVRTDFTGTYDIDVGDDGRSNDLRISRLSVEFEDRARGYEVTLGRQRRSDSGVLGRFDGFRGACRFASHFEISAVVGLPVTSTSDSAPDTDTILAGGALNVDDLWVKGLQGQVFAISQHAYGLMGRTAVGGDIRYANKKSYSFVYVDYDVGFDSLNTVIASSTYYWRPDTDFRILVDRRNSPVLTLVSALQGQPVSDLDELKDELSESEIRDLVLDRTLVFWSATAGATHRLDDRFQISADLGLTYSGSSDSGVQIDRPTDPNDGQVIEGIESSGPDYSASIQLLVNDWLVDGGVGSASLRYFEGDRSRSAGVALFSRFLLFEGFRVSPRLRWDWRDTELQGGTSTLRPSLEVDWRLGAFVLNADAGIQWLEPLYDASQGTAIEPERDTSYFVELGARWEF